MGTFRAVGLNFSVQVLTIRYRTKANLGASSWALTGVAVPVSANLLGLAKTVVCFVPMYQERRELGAAFGAISFASGCIVGLGASIVALFVGSQLLLGERLVADPASARLLLLAHPAWLAFAVALASLAELRVSRDALDVDGKFPELARLIRTRNHP